MRPATGQARSGRNERAVLVCRIGEGAEAEAERGRPGAREQVVDLDTRTVGGDEVARELGREQRPPPVELLMLFAGSATDLRRAVPAVAGLPCAARFHAVIAAAPDHLPPPLPVVPGSDAWQGLLDARVSRTGTQGWSVELAFLDPVEPSGVFAALSRAVTGARRQPVAGPVSRVLGAGAGFWGPGDPVANTARRVEAVLRTGDPSDGDGSPVAETRARTVPVDGPVAGSTTGGGTPERDVPGESASAGGGPAAGVPAKGSVPERGPGEGATAEGTPVPEAGGTPLRPPTGTDGPSGAPSSTAGGAPSRSPGAETASSPPDTAGEASAPLPGGGATPAHRPAAEGDPSRPSTAGDTPGEGESTAATLHRHDPHSARWSRLGRPNTPGGLHFRVHDVPPVDEYTVNPQGFTRAADGARGRLLMRQGRLAVVAEGTELFRVAEDGTVTDSQIAALRGLRQVDVAWGRHSGPLAAVRAVASLAAAGVPLTGKAPPAWSRCLGGQLHALLAQGRGTKLSDELRREEHSIRLRRAALRTHGTHARWAALGAQAGLPPQAGEEVSVLLVTNRPDMLGFGLRQVARQRSVRLELVLALHGFGPEHPEAARALAEFRACGIPLTVHEADPGLPLGSVLNQAVRRSRGTVLAKMDDDDWYGPDHLADLLMARRYACADVVGNAPEFVYLQDLDLTVHQPRPAERTATALGGGTLVFDRRTWAEVGGFRPVPCGEDSELLQAVRSTGGRVHRIHGCNYVLRRAGRGHTWNVGAGYFLTGSEKRQRPGWHPSALLEADPRDLPARSRISRALDRGVPPAGNRGVRDHVDGESA